MAEYRVLRTLANHHLHTFQPSILAMESILALGFRCILRDMFVAILDCGKRRLPSPPTQTGLGREAHVLKELQPGNIPLLINLLDLQNLELHL